MQPDLDFASLEKLKKFLDAIGLRHASTMEHYRSEDNCGFFHQPQSRNEASRSSTATCVASLVNAGLWNEDFSLWSNTGRVAGKLISKPWRSAGLEPNNPFSLAFIMEGVLELQKVQPKYQNSSKHKKLLRSASKILLRSFDDGSIKIHPYPPSAYLTQLAFRVLQRLGKTTKTLTAEVNSWSRSEVNRQIALISTKSRSADPLNLAYAVMLAATTAEDEETSPENKQLLSRGLALFFESQYEDGTWPPSRPLFHYPNVGNAYCFEYELLTQLLRCRPLRAELLRYITPFIERTAYRLEVTRFDLNAEKPGAAVGWPSGHHPQIEGPESWSTASVYDFVYALNALVAEAIRRVVFQELGAIYSPPVPLQTQAGDTFAKSNFLDADLKLPGKSGRISLRKTIAEAFVYPIAREVNLVDKGGRLSDATPMSAILFGPPGTSKTELAKLISGYLGWPLLAVDPSYLVQHGLDNIQAQANRLFSMLNMSEQIVALLDEFDEMGRDREGNQELLSRFITTAMLPKLISINKQRKIVFLLATNYISRFDAAFRRGGRFDMLVQVMPPNFREKVRQWPSLKSAYQKLSKEDQDTSRRKIADLTYLECKQLASKLKDVTSTADISGLIDIAHDNCTLRLKIDGGTWESQCDTDRASIRIPNK